jgi:hypothetical protein
MSATTTTVIEIVIVALGIAGVIVWYTVARRRQTQLLHEQYGSEYDRTVAHAASKRAAEAELVQRQERVAYFDIRPLTAEQRDLFGQQWHDVQELFVDDPGRAVTKADKLVAEVMRTRGYPVADFDQRASDFEQRASDLSVHHAVFIQNYRAARAVAERHRQGAATTEELRRAMVFCRDLLEDLLQAEELTSDRPVPRVVERDVPLPADQTVNGGERVQRQPIAPPRSDREAR